MRYTTLIDISELPIYRNVNCRLVYLHLTLKAGYHDSDRDIVLTSIRRLAADVGITDAACRHAISQLEQAQLLTRTGGVWMVKKWLLQMEPITTRATTKRQQRAAEAEAARIAQHEARERERAIEDARRQNLRAQGKTSFMVYYEQQRELAHQGDAIAAEFIRRHAAVYQEHSNSINNQQKT